ncbi:type II toxin-antitoxin system ParD family antitoxin [Aquimarina hainanensis]|uniref:Type II toxin-antitoxin system ParD family antitoxin n=1 Tax=Aquimarina hainanensis TaxID=1578017 RepID=A0ABW5N754_9FLAO
MNINFSQEQEEFMPKQVSSGEYQNNNEVIRDPLKLHSTCREKVIKDLRKEIEEGLSSPDSTRSMQDIIDSKKQG